MDFLTPQTAIGALIFALIISLASWFANRFWRGWETRQIAQDDRLDEHDDDIAGIKEKQAAHHEKHRSHEREIDQINERLRNNGSSRRR